MKDWRFQIDGFRVQIAKYLTVVVTGAVLTAGIVHLSAAGEIIDRVLAVVAGVLESQADPG